LLDIDTPEKGQTCYKEAKDRLTELIDGKQVELKSGKEDKDTYDRLLRYVFYNGTNINMLMVREGWANLYFYNKDTPYYSQLIEAEQAAKIDGLCVWR
jgi:micrococcal nuclease